MKLIYKIAISTAIITAAIIVVKACGKDNDNLDERLLRVADEGYETADDILFPGKFKPNSRVHYGPVIPS